MFGKLSVYVNVEVGWAGFWVDRVACEKKTANGSSQRPHNLGRKPLFFRPSAESAESAESARCRYL